MTNVIIDTNVFVKALMGSKTCRPIFNALLKNKFRLITSKPLIEELIDVLSRPYIRVRIDERDKVILFSILDNVEKIVSPVKGLRVCRDPEDDFILETCLAAGHSCILVTSDKDLLELKPNPFHKVRIISPEEFLTTLCIE